MLVACWIAFSVPMAGVCLDSANGVRAWWALRHELAEARAELQALEQKHQGFVAEIDALRNDPFEIERRAREQLQMIFPGERILRCCD